MRIRKLMIWMARSFLSFAIFSFFFLIFLRMDFDKKMEGVYGDIYEFSSEEAKVNVFMMTNALCNTIVDQEKEINRFDEICSNKDLISNITENCRIYTALLQSGEIEENLELEQLCLLLSRGGIEKKCMELKEVPFSPSLQKACLQYKEGELNNKMLFSQLLKLSMPPSSPFSLHVFLFLPFIVLLLFFLFMLHKENMHEFVFSLGRVLFNLGAMLIFIYSITNIYNYASPPDTTSIMDAFSGTSLPPRFIQEASFTLFPLILKHIFDVKYLILGIIFFCSGFLLKLSFKHGIT